MTDSKSADTQTPFWDVTVTLDLPGGAPVPDMAVIEGQGAALKGAFLSWGKCRYGFQLERGEEKGKLHWQCRVALAKKVRKETLVRKIGDALNIAPPRRSLIHARPTSSAVSGNYKIQFDYVTKKATRVEGTVPYTDRKLYTGEDVEIIKESPYPWQAQLLTKLQSPVNDREIMWIYEPKGNHGKTAFIKYCAFHNLAWRLPIGKAHQLRAVAVTMVKQRGMPTGVLVDLPRSLGTDDSVRDQLSALEEIKGGFVSSAMFGKLEEIFFDPPHVIIVANWLPPDMNAMSRDRWAIWSIDSAMNLYKMTPKMLKSAFHAMGIKKAPEFVDTSADGPATKGFTLPSGEAYDSAEEESWRNGGGAGAGAGGHASKRARLE